jgi:DNA-binding NtrC family response regulator
MPRSWQRGDCCRAAENPFATTHGHEKGAFTGADKQKPGRFELAAGGTLFLDEVSDLPPNAQAVLRAHPWPGNIRELANAVERALILADGGLLTAAHFGLEAGRPQPLQGPGGPPVEFSPPEALADLERRAILAALHHTRGNKTQAAALLGITRTQLHTRVKRYGLPA